MSAADAVARLPARRRLHDAQPLRRAQDARGARAGAGVHHEGRAVGGLPRVLRHGAGPAAPARQRGLPALHRVALRRAVDRGEGPLRPARSVERALAEARDLRAAPRDPERRRARPRLGRGRDHRLGLPVLQRPGRAPARCARRARRRATAASWPCATSSSRRATSSSSSPTTRSAASGTRCAARRRVLAERCEYMVRKPGEEFAPRAKKDPRDLRVLDPACGSGHFLLYAFDLLLAIYEEAYADPESPKSEATGKTLAEDYPSLDALRKAVPGLILAHNLHGVDIDPRCAQIAQLALWMRAQKAYRDFGIGARRAPADPPLEHRRRRAARRRRADRQGVRREARRRRARARVHGARRVAEPRGRPGAAPARRAARGASGRSAARPATSSRRPRSAFAPRSIASCARKASATNTRRRLFADDAAQGVGAARRRREEVRRGADESAVRRGQHAGKEGVREGVPADEERLYAAFVERGIELLHRGAGLGRSRRAPGSSSRASRSGARRSLLQEAPRLSSPTSGTASWTARWSRRPRTAWRRAHDRVHSVLWMTPLTRRPQRFCKRWSVRPRKRTA